MIMNENDFDLQPLTSKSGALKVPPSTEDISDNVQKEAIIDNKNETISSVVDTCTIEEGSSAQPMDTGFSQQIQKDKYSDSSLLETILYVVLKILYYAIVMLLMPVYALGFFGSFGVHLFLEIIGIDESKQPKWNFQLRDWSVIHIQLSFLYWMRLSAVGVIIIVILIIIDFLN